MPPKNYRSKGKSKGKWKSKKTAYVKDKSAGNSNARGKILDLFQFNKSPLPITSRKVFHYSTGFQMATGAGAANLTQFVSLASLLDPCTTIARWNPTTNYAYYPVFLGATTGLFTNYRVQYVDVTLRFLNKTAGTFPQIVCGTTIIGSGDYPVADPIQQIAERPSHMTKVLEYTGDTVWVTMKFRVYMNKAAASTRATYDSDIAYRWAYNTPSNTGPWLAISIGDSAHTAGNQVAQEIEGQIYLESHVKLERPIQTD